MAHEVDSCLLKETDRRLLKETKAVYSEVDNRQSSLMLQVGS